MTSMPKGIVAFLLCCQIWILGCADPSKKNENEEAITLAGLEGQLTGLIKAYDLMGMSVVLLANGQIAWQGHLGTANLEKNTPIGEHTHYRVASISKTVTAMALLQLWEAGKVDLDKDVGHYLGWPLKHPDFPETDITLRHLLTHTSGIRDGEGYARFSGEMVAKHLNIRELFVPNGTNVTKDQFASHRPGTYFSYANCTWGLIASVVEMVSQKRFDTYCHDHIFKPMGLTAHFNVSELKDLDSLAVLYRYKEGKWVPQADDYSKGLPPLRAPENYELGKNGLLFGPQGSLRSTAKDLAKLALMLIRDGTYNGQQILEKNTVDVMLKSHWTHNGENGDTWDNFFLSYGLGTHQTLNREGGDVLFPDREMVGHPGIAYGLLSDMYFEKEGNSGIVFITNGSKHDFKYGQNTSFYEVEEAVFQVVFPFLKALENKEQKEAR
ncbi:serine hydrolase domain-containing protein [Maribacter sp. 2307ULW6-5]|uniref:serine hydrolase domain-containing protein n=1 Tax=Maribacter sp. 2307ULW6-5 TaxID=3386275 RepID=UPI0039BD50F3